MINNNLLKLQVCHKAEFSCHKIIYKLGFSLLFTKSNCFRKQYIYTLMKFYNEFYIFIINVA